MGIADALELGRALGRAPRRVVVLGVEGSSFAAGTGLSAPVESALEGVVDAIVRDLAWDGSDA